MSRPLRVFLRWLGLALAEVVLAETTSTLGKLNLLLSGLVFIAFLVIFAGPGLAAEVVRLALDREPDHVSTISTLIAFLAVVLGFYACVWMLRDWGATRRG